MTHALSWLFFFPFCVDFRRGRGREAKRTKHRGKTGPRSVSLGCGMATVGGGEAELQVEGTACCSRQPGELKELGTFQEQGEA